jgi:FixJ family two-component response regulator
MEPRPACTTSGATSPCSRSRRPGRSGYDVLAFARAPDPEMPVILMSGHVGGVHGEGGEDEPDASLEKPFTAKLVDGVIDGVIEAILRRRRSPG